jgi:hypothetical protein
MYVLACRSDLSDALFAQPDVLVDNDSVQALDPAATPEGATFLDLSLARFRSMLEKQYGNDNNPGHYVFICADNTELPLTPFMMHQWAIALVCSLNYATNGANLHTA